MAGMERAVAVGYPQHVTQRGNFRWKVFLGDEDREICLVLLAKNASLAELEILGYCLTSNHADWIVVPRMPESMDTAILRVRGSYSPWLDIRLRRTGHAWLAPHLFRSARAVLRGLWHAIGGVQAGCGRRWRDRRSVISGGVLKSIPDW